MVLAKKIQSSEWIYILVQMLLERINLSNFAHARLHKHSAPLWDRAESSLPSGSCQSKMGGGAYGREMAVAQCVKCRGGRARGPQPTQGHSGVAKRGKG